VDQSKRRKKMLLRRGRRRKNGEKITIWRPKHTSAMILATTATLMALQRRSVGSCI